MKEFEFIESLKRISLSSPYGIGDDASVADDLLIAKDLMVENVHFAPSESVNVVVDRLFASNISDIAAMGGISAEYQALFGTAIPKTIDKKDLLDAIYLAAEKYNVTLIGGDTSFSKQGLFLSLTIIGKRNRYILTRAGAKPGDKVYLSRPTGYAKYELRRRLGFLNGNQIVESNREPEHKLGDILGRSGGVTACIDISDGLGRDLSHIAEASGARIILRKENLPLPKLLLPKARLYEYALSSGEEYALAFTVKPGTEIIYGKPFYEIGLVSEGAGCFMTDDDGSLTDVSHMGYEHD